MADLDTLFAVPEKTIRFGRKALNELNAILGEYFGLEPYERVEEPDPESGGKFIKYVQRVPFPGDEADRKGTEALLRIKDGFDQMAWASVRALNPKLKATDSVYFPWADSAEGVKTRLTGKSCKIPPELWPTFLGLKPHCT